MWRWTGWVRRLARRILPGSRRTAIFCGRCSVDETFPRRTYGYGLIERDLGGLLRKSELSEDSVLVAALAVLEIDPAASHAGFRLWGEAAHRVVLFHEGEKLERRLIADTAGYRLEGGAGEASFSALHVDFGAPPSALPGISPSRGEIGREAASHYPLPPEGEMSRSDRGGVATSSALTITARAETSVGSANLSARVVITPNRAGKSVSVLLNG